MRNFFTTLVLVTFAIVLSGCVVEPWGGWHHHGGGGGYGYHDHY